MSRNPSAGIALVGLALAAFLGDARSATAQVQLEISPFTGLFAPLSDMWEEAGPLDDQVISMEHAPALSIGTRLTVWLGAHFGLEGAVSHAESRVKATDVTAQAVVFSSQQSLDGSVTVFSARAVWRSAPSPAPMAFHFLGGLGALTRRGDAYGRLEGTTDLAAVAGGGIRLRINDALALRLDLADYLSNARFERRVVAIDLNRSRQGNATGDPVTRQEVVELDGGLQNDLVLTQSLVITIGGR